MLSYRGQSDHSFRPNGFLVVQGRVVDVEERPSNLAWFTSRTGCINAALKGHGFNRAEKVHKYQGLSPPMDVSQVRSTIYATSYCRREGLAPAYRDTVEGVPGETSKGYEIHQ